MAPVVSRNLRFGSSWHSLTHLLAAKFFFFFLDPKSLSVARGEFFCLSDIK